MDGLLNDKKVDLKYRSKQNYKNKKIKRGNKKNLYKYFNIFSSNSAQLEGKLQSFKYEIETTNAAVFTLQETHYAKKGKLRIKDFEVFEAIRNKAKGGSAIGAHKGLKPFLIQEYSDEFELLVVEIQVVSNNQICNWGK